jgi:hypothetical protein
MRRIGSIYRACLAALHLDSATPYHAPSSGSPVHVLLDPPPKDFMTAATSIPFRLTFAACAGLAIAGLLAWEYTHGGVPSHHFLQRADMPAFSNWWGLVIVPVLGWFASARLVANADGVPTIAVGQYRLVRRAVLSLAGALVFGLVIAVSFTLKLQPVLELVPFAMLLAVVALPIFRPHYLFGFVLGMATAIGAVLPLIVGSVLAAVSAVMYFAVRPLLTRIWSSVRRR